MRNNYQKDAVWVIAEGTELSLYNADGRRIVLIEKINVQDIVGNGFCTAEVGLICNVGTMEEMEYQLIKWGKKSKCAMFLDSDDVVK